MDYTLTLSMEILGLGIAIASATLKFYTTTLKKLQNHDDRLGFIEFRLDRIERKLDELNGRMRVNKPS